MKLSKQQKAKFFSEVRKELNLILSYFDDEKTVTKEQLLETFTECDRPFLYGNVKWAIKLHCNEFPTHEELTGASETKEQFQEWVEYEQQAEYRIFGGGNEM